MLLLAGRQQEAPRLELLRDGIDVGLVTLTNGSSSWVDNGPAGISYPTDGGYPPAITAELVEFVSLMVYVLLLGEGRKTSRWR
jgi:hypothetical protein